MDGGWTNKPLPVWFFFLKKKCSHCASRCPGVKPDDVRFGTTKKKKSHDASPVSDPEQCHQHVATLPTVHDRLGARIGVEPVWLASPQCRHNACQSSSGVIRTRPAMWFCVATYWHAARTLSVCATTSPSGKVRAAPYRKVLKFRRGVKR